MTGQEIPTMEEVRGLFEELTKGREFITKRIGHDLKGLYLWKIIVGEDEYTYRRERGVEKSVFYGDVHVCDTLIAVPVEGNWVKSNHDHGKYLKEFIEAVEAIDTAPGPDFSCKPKTKWLIILIIIIMISII